MSTPSIELKFSGTMNAYDLIGDITTRVLNAKAVVNSLYNSIMDGEDDDAPLNLTIVLQEQIFLLEQLVDELRPSDLEVEA